MPARGALSGRTRGKSIPLNVFYERANGMTGSNNRRRSGWPVIIQLRRMRKRVFGALKCQPVIGHRPWNVLLQGPRVHWQVIKIDPPLTGTCPDTFIVRSVRTVPAKSAHCNTRTRSGVRHVTTDVAVGIFLFVRERRLPPPPLLGGGARENRTRDRRLRKAPHFPCETGKPGPMGRTITQKRFSNLGNTFSLTMERRPLRAGPGPPRGGESRCCDYYKTVTREDYRKFQVHSTFYCFLRFLQLLWLLSCPAPQSLPLLPPVKDQKGYRWWHH